MSKFVVLVSLDDGESWDRASNHLYEGGLFPTFGEALAFSDVVFAEYDNAGVDDVQVFVTEVFA
jgi:hypothetical protein